MRLLQRQGLHSQKLAGLLFIAVLLAYELVHVMEFRCIKDGESKPDDQPFNNHPGVTCGEVDTAWEVRAFGGRMYPHMS